MNRASRIASATGAALILVACTLQGHQGSAPIPTTGLTAQPKEPKYVPLEDGDIADDLPAALSGSPSVRKIIAESTGPSTRLGAESFALNVVNFYVDVRPKLADEDVLNDIGAKSLRQSTRKYIVQDKALQREIGTRRHVDTSVHAWVRSSTEGTSDSPEAVRAEVAVNVVAPGIEFRTWFKTRVDVVREQGRWKLAHLASSVGGPDDVKELTTRQRRDYLTGKGWREIAP